MDDGVNNGGLKGGFVFAALAVFAAAVLSSRERCSTATSSTPRVR